MHDMTTHLLSRIEMLEAELGRLKALAATMPATAEHIAPVPSSRRDLLRYGAVALGAGAMGGGMPAASVQAANGDPLILGSTANTASAATELICVSAGLSCIADGGTALQGRTNHSGGVGVLGLAHADSAAGVVGMSTGGAYGPGVQGNSTHSSTASAGVQGFAASPNAAAVRGTHHIGTAVLADIPSWSTTNCIALYALNYSSYAGAAPGAGGFGAYGISAKGPGLVGATATAGAAALVGATNGVSGAYAAALYGPVVVAGDFTVVGGAKSAAVPHPDGSHRRLYCLESPESWFEDFGEAALVCGEASVPLDPGFAAVVDTSKYHVFLTGYDGRSDLSVFDRSAAGFRVRASGAGEGTLSWRVVAKRKDIAAPRFEKVEIPKEPTLPDVPASVDAQMPSAPEIPRQGSAAAARPKTS